MALNTLHDVVICALQKKKNKGMIVKASVNNVSHIRCESEKKKKRTYPETQQDPGIKAISYYLGVSGRTLEGP